MGAHVSVLPSWLRGSREGVEISPKRSSCEAGERSLLRLPLMRRRGRPEESVSFVVTQTFVSERPQASRRFLGVCQVAEFGSTVGHLPRVDDHLRWSGVDIGSVYVHVDEVAGPSQYEPDPVLSAVDVAVHQAPLGELAIPDRHQAVCEMCRKRAVVGEPKQRDQLAQRREEVSSRCGCLSHAATVSKPSGCAVAYAGSGSWSWLKATAMGGCPGRRRTSRWRPGDCYAVTSVAASRTGIEEGWL